jgi:aminopeptidase
MPESLPGGLDMSWEEREAAGVNHSGVHTDFMVGSAEVDAFGVAQDGAEVPILRRGAWVLD